MNQLWRCHRFRAQQLDYLAFNDIYLKRIFSFHDKDAEFIPDGRQGVYSEYDRKDRGSLALSAL